MIKKTMTKKQIDNFHLFDRAIDKLNSDVLDCKKEWPSPWKGELPFPDNEIVGTPYDHTIQLRPDVEQLIQRHKVDLRMANVVPSYNMRDDIIVLPPPSRFRSKSLWYQTLFHELGHWTGPRLGRFFTMSFNHPLMNGIEEVTAELVSMFMCEAHDIKGQHHAKYIVDYSTSIPNDKRFSQIIMDRAIKATNYLLQNTGDAK